MSFYLEGGDFTHDKDGGIFSLSPYQSASLVYLYETGNTIYRWLNSSTVISGNFRNFYEVNLPLNSRLIPDTGFNIINSGYNILYTENNNPFYVQIKEFGGDTSSILISGKNEWREF